MAAAVPTMEPVEVYAGDSIHFTKSLADYPSSEWDLAYRILKQSGDAIDITAAADGSDFEIHVTAAATAAWTAGDYWLIGFVTDGTDRVQIYRGQLKVLPDPAVSANFDGRSYLQRVLEKLEAVIEEGVIREVIRYSYGGVTTEVQSLKDALDARDRIKAAIGQEVSQVGGKQRKILTRFTKPR